MKVVFLGTSSAKPTLMRGLPAMAVIREQETLLFDCGEGTQLQLQRSIVKPKRISRILITHLHGDHVNGLIGFLMSMELESREFPLEVYGPPGIRNFIELNRRCLNTSFSYPLTVKQVEKKTVVDDPAYRIEAVEVDHGVLTFAYALRETARPGRFHPEKAIALGVPEGPLFGRLQQGETVQLPGGGEVRPEQVLGPPRPGKLLVYAPDTIPCSRLVELARGADLLVHDGTYLSDLQEIAAARRHSTARDAATVAAEAGVKRLVLTHISPRYGSDQPLRDEAREIFAETVVARDLMVVEV
jgi:ribonuclease Z